MARIIEEGHFVRGTALFAHGWLRAGGNTGCCSWIHNGSTKGGC
jgi:hypothetical protein